MQDKPGSLVVPQRHTLDGFTATTQHSDGIDISQLDVLTTVMVSTSNTVYRLVILDPLNARVLVQGGHLFPRFTEARFNGASSGGSFLKLAWIGRGLRMEFHARGKRVVTSRVKSLAQVSDASGGIDLHKLETFETLVATTANTSYQITVLDPSRSHILIQGGRFFPEPTKARLFGGSFGGDFLKPAWFGCGLRMELYSGGYRVITSTVRSLEVNQDAKLPGPF